MAHTGNGNSGPGYRERPDYRVDFIPCAKRVRVGFNGEIVADSTRSRLLLETNHRPVYYFPRDDVRADLLRRTAHSTHCPFKGDASYWTVSVNGREAENAVWSYESPFDEVAAIGDYVAFYWDRMDQWLEEDEEIAVHPRNPFVRIDVLASRRRVRVALAGEVLADTEKALFLFETGMPVRYYIPPEDVRMDLLQDSNSTSSCPYKGTARYWSASIGGKQFEDIAWAYPVPLGEVRRIAGRVCFYDDRVDAVEVGGETLPKPEPASG